MLVMHFVDSDLVSCQLLRTVPMLRPQLYYNTIQCEWAPCCAGREENEEWSQGEHDRSIVTNEKIDLKIKLKVQWVSLRIQFLVRIVSIHCAHQVRPDLLTLEDQAQAFEGYWLDETRSRFSIRTSNSARVFGHRILPENTHYPSTPELKASRLSSAVARPVRANTFARP